jgi:hypothetical protein
VGLQVWTDCRFRAKFSASRPEKWGFVLAADGFRPKRCVASWAMSFPAHRELSHGLIRRVDRALPWAAAASVLTGVLATSLAGAPAHLSGIALQSTFVFLLERGVVVIALLLIATTLLARTLEGELPTGFSATTGSVTYAASVVDAASSSETATTELAKGLAEQGAELSEQRKELAKLSETVDAIDVIVRSRRGGRGTNSPER